MLDYWWLPQERRSDWLEWGCRLARLAILTNWVYSASDIGSLTHILNLVVGNDTAYTTFSPGSVG